jgi:uncharacterized membrane protein YkoI
MVSPTPFIAVSSQGGTTGESEKEESMRLNRRIVVGAAAAGILAVGGGVGIAQAVGGDSEEPVTGRAAEQAKAAALDAAGGGTVLEVEKQDGDGAGVYEVEVRRADGSTVEIHLDHQFQQVGSTADDDGGADSDDGSADDGSSDS